MVRPFQTAPRFARGLGLARRLAGAGGLAALALAGGAAAQSMSANSASFNAGFGRAAGDENRPVNVALGDSSGRFSIVGGLAQTNVPGSVFGVVNNTLLGGFSGFGGALDNASGAAGGAPNSTIGDNLNVVVRNPSQTNAGVPSADSATNGK